jgi:hypothetical protein
MLPCVGVGLRRSKSQDWQDVAGVYQVGFEWQKLTAPKSVSQARFVSMSAGFADGTCGKSLRASRQPCGSTNMMSRSGY